MGGLEAVEVQLKPAKFDVYSLVDVDAYRGRAGAQAELRATLRRQAQTIVAVYLGTAGVWIAASDWLLALFVTDADLVVRLSVYKGFAFVAATAVLLYLLLRRSMTTIDRAFVALEREEAERVRQEERRRRAEAIVASTDDAIISKAPDGTITSWNPAAQLMFGYSESEVVGQPIDLLIPPEALNDEPSSGERVRQHETTRMRKDGALLPVAITFSPIWGPDDSQVGEQKIVGVAEIVRDVTERKRAEAIAEREQRFAHSLIESMPGIFYLYDKQGRFLRWNQNFETLCGYTSDEIASLSPLAFFEAEDKSLLDRRIAEVFETGEASVEASFVAKDGTGTPYFFTGKRIMYNDVTCLVGVGVDISKRIVAQEALKELNESLERKVDERTRDLELARARAEAADRTKSAFLATMSHELRTPLNSILGFTGILLQELPGELNSEQSKQLGMVRSSARHLLDLINDVLDISKIEAGQLEVRNAPFDLIASVQRVLDSVVPLAQKKGLALEASLPDGPAPMESDQRRVEQVLLNLLNNALKFTERGSVSLVVERLDSSNPDVKPEQAVRISVRDTGVGMRPEDMSKLFQPFQQLDSGLQRQHEGTGLGLAICRRLTELLAGTIGVESQLGQGSVFSLTLPNKRENP